MTKAFSSLYKPRPGRKLTLRQDPFERLQYQTKSMALKLYLSPDLERRLRDEAERRGLKLEVLFQQHLEARWGGSM